MAGRPGTRAGWTRGVLVSVATAAVLMAPPAAEAHTELLDSRPAAGEAAESAVDRIRLEFATPVLEEFTDVVVTGGGSTATVAEPLVSGGVVEADVDGLDSAGQYVVSYRTVAVDGHPVTGSFTFDLGAGAVGAASRSRSTDTAAADHPRGTSLLMATAVSTAVLGLGVGALRRRRGAPAGA